MKRLNNMLIVGIDTGNYNIKTATQCFTSGYKEVGKEAIFEDLLAYSGKYYTLSNARIPVRTQKTKSDEFLILSMFGIAKELAENNLPNGAYDAVLAVGLPPGFLSADTLKRDLQEYFCRQLDFQYNKNRYCINVKRVLVCPQGYSGLLANATTSEMKCASITVKRPIDILSGEAEALLIDIGGGTVDVVGLRNGKPVPEYHYSLENGVVNMYNSINAELRSTTGSELSESAINSVLSGANVRVSPEDRGVIHKHIRNYGSNLLMKLTELRLPFRNSYVLLMGGGSNAIKEYWAQTGSFGKLDFIDDIRANAQGFEEMAFNALSRE